MAVAKSCEGLIGQYIAGEVARQPGEFNKSSSLKPCDRVDE